ncbi:MAG: response regulator [Candidatus Zixiibacteriota bacterium]
MAGKLLVVDDEAFVRELMQEMCSQLGYSVCTAATSAELPELIESEDFDAAIVDLHLRDCHGLDIVKLIKDRSPDLSVVLMTGNAALDDLIAAMRLGIYDCILKPFRVREIKTIISGACADTGRKAEIRGLRERLAEFEAKAAGTARRNSRRLVMNGHRESTTVSEAEPSPMVATQT